MLSKTIAIIADALEMALDLFVWVVVRFFMAVFLIILLLIAVRK